MNQESDPNSLRRAQETIRKLQALKTDPVVSRLLSREKPRPATSPEQPSGFADLMNILDQFPTVLGYLNARRSTSQFVDVNSEADVQDLLFVMLKPVFPNLVYEEPSSKGAAGYSIADFALPQMGLVIEVKYIPDQARVKPVSDEISEDIWKYSTQTMCERIVFFVYDPNILIPDREAFRNAYSEQDYRVRGRSIQVIPLIKP